MIGNIRDVKECPDCGSDNIYYNDNLDQVICRDCGCIFEPFAAGAEEEEEEAGVARASRGARTAKAKKPARKAKRKK
jgi:transcription initiation factor TFIIIB Brf1 subunit/transcription initiation factor TFIIB